MDVDFSLTYQQAKTVERIADDSANSWTKTLSISQITQKIDAAADTNTALNGFYIKPISLEADLTVNRVRVWMPYTAVEGEGLGNELLTDFLGFDFATQFGYMKDVISL